MTVAGPAGVDDLPVVDWRDVVDPDEYRAMSVDDVRAADRHWWTRLTPRERLDHAERAREWRAGLAASLARAGAGSADEYLAVVASAGQHEDQQEKSAKRSAADRLVDLAIARYQLGRAEDGEPYAVPRDGANVARMFRGGRASLRAALAAAYATDAGRVPPAQALGDALAVLEGRALAEPRHVLPLRAYREDDEVVVDLGDEAGRAVVVDAAGWRIVPRLPRTFRRSELTGTLPDPVPGDLNTLFSILNVGEPDRPLVVAFLVASLLGVPVPILFLRGPAGAAKTSAARTLTSLVDPSPAPTRAAPKDPEAWAVAASGSYVVCLDNLDVIPTWLSDALCRAVTGEGMVRRALYTDSGLSVVVFRRAVILTAIDAGAMRGDLADRLLAVDLDAIPDEHRRDDDELAATFRAAHPAMFGAILTMTSRVLRRLPAVRLERRPRMADFARILAAVDEELGTDALARYLDQRGELQREAAEGDRIGAAIIAFVASRDRWSGTAGELLATITPEHPPRGWPATPRALSGALRRIALPLRAAGIEITYMIEGHDRRRTVYIEQTGIRPSAPSAVPDPSVDRADGSADGRAPTTHRPSAFGADRPQEPTPPTHDADDADGADGAIPTLSGRTIWDDDAPTCDTCGRRKRRVLDTNRFVCTFPHRAVAEVAS